MKHIHPNHSSTYAHPDRLKSPIPFEAGKVDGWKTIPIDECDEPLVPLGAFGPYREILTSSVYFGEDRSSPYKYDEIGGALLSIFVRKSVAERLITAQSLLPTGKYLVVFDAYRPIEVQSSLYETYLSDQTLVTPDWSEQELSLETQKYVSIPSDDATKPSPHNTGGSVDLAIIAITAEQTEHVTEIEAYLKTLPYDSDDGYEEEMRKLEILKHGTMLNFGCAFDDGTEMAALAQFETPSLDLRDIQPRDNRRLLYNAMIQSGFEPYEHEWWHYNAPESQMGAQTAGLRLARFGAAVLSATNLKHEAIRRQHLKGVNIMTDIIRLYDWVVRSDGELKKWSTPEEREIFMRVLGTQARLGSFRRTTIPRALRISPNN